MKANKFIYEVPIYDGALKNWRILNLLSGTFYSMSYDTFEEANANIDEEMRAELRVKKVTLQQIVEALNATISH